MDYRKKLIHLLCTVFCILLAWGASPALAQPANDNKVDAQVISGALRAGG